jgi:Ca2+-transporting ATPase
MTIVPHPDGGLGAEEARARLAKHGPNALPEARPRGFGDILRSTLREPMFLFLLAAAGLYLLVGDLGEGALLLLAAGVSIGLVVMQEGRNERALAALRALAEPVAKVVRDGVERSIPAREIVPGDLLLIAEGVRVPADARLAGGDMLVVDESALTGESVPVTKTPGTDAGEDPEPGGDGTPFLFAGTLVVRGQGVAHVVRTGAGTRLGRIGASLGTGPETSTPLQKKTTALVGWLALVALGFCVLVAVAYGLLRGVWMEGALAGITLAISLMPEEFPMVLAIFMALGSWRLARERVLVRRAVVIETLGAATVLCVDKTGTLTENRMAVAAFWAGGVRARPTDGGVPAPMAALLEAAALASAPRPTDPMDRAVRALFPDDGAMPIRTVPLRPGAPFFVQVWARPDGSVEMAAKGAPEAIFRLCRLEGGALRAAEEAVGTMAGEGLRILGVARRRAAADSGGDPAEVPFLFEGLVGFEDPVRADVPAALAEVRGAGIAVAMITGDYPATALEIARRAGIDTEAGVLTGAEIAALDPAALRTRVRDTRVFARIAPEQKLAIVRAFAAAGGIVAMTGDGINDAPALEAADIGIAMGQRGTDVAREAADIVLLDDRFASIVGGIRLGRRIFTNLRKALTFVTAIHVPIAGLALLPILLGLPPLLFPLHVVLLELVIDPVSSMVFEAEPGRLDAMRRPPRPAREPLFGRRQFALAMLQGAAILAVVLGLYAAAIDWGVPAGEARGLGFAALIAGNLALAFADSAAVGTAFLGRQHRTFWIIGGIAAAAVGAVLYVPPLAAMFQVVPPHWLLLGAALVAAIVAGGWLGLLRKLGVVEL